MRHSQSPIIVTSTNDIIPVQVWLARYECEFAYGPTDTPRAKRRDIEVFREFLASKIDIGNASIFDITHCLLTEFICARLDIEAASTVQRRLATITHWARWVVTYIPSYRPPKVRPPKPAPRPPRWLTSEQVTALRLAAPLCGETEFERARARFCIDAMLLAGFRAFELLNLYEHQISADGKLFLNVKRKGNQFSDVTICSTLRLSLTNYMQIRRDFLKNGFFKNRWGSRPTLPIVVSTWGAAFSNPASFKLSYKGLWRIVAEAAEQSGIVELSPHMCRHTFGRKLYESTLDLVLVAKAMGHTNTVTTLGYTTPAEDDILVAVNRMAENFK